MSASVDPPATEDAPLTEHAHRHVRSRVYVVLGVVFALLSVTFAGAVAFAESKV